MREDPSAVQVQGQLALTLLAVDPVGLGGLHLRSRAGPVRDMFCAPFKSLFPKARRIAPSISDLQLFGGVDIGETLTRGEIIRAKGILETPTPLVFTMAERCPRCGLRFERGEGEFIGAVGVNTVVTFTLLLGFMVVAAVFIAQGEGVAGFLVGALAIAVGFPIVFYPFSHTVWLTVGLAMDPLEEGEAPGFVTSEGP